MKISVIMLVYNREYMMKRAIESIKAQTFTDYEFVIINNGSSDNSGKVADEYSANDRRFRVIHREKGSIGSGRNTGLDVAKGDYITFVDDDDWCKPDFLEFLYNLIAENGADVAICGSDGRAFDDKLIMTAEEAVIELMWRKRYTVAFPAKMFSRRLAKKIRFPEYDKYDDITQMHKLLAQANMVAYHGVPKYTFYRHDNNNSAWTVDHNLIRPKILDEYIRAYQDRTIWLAELFSKNTALWSYFQW